MIAMKCKYAHCKHQSREINKAEAIKCGSVYYHTDCYKEIETIRQIIDVYVNTVDDNPSFSELRKIINQIVYKQGVSPEFLLFALTHSSIHYPAGLFYIVKDQEMLKAWDIEKKKQTIKDSQFDATANYEEDSSFNYKHTNTSSFLRILT